MTMTVIKQTSVFTSLLLLSSNFLVLTVAFSSHQKTNLIAPLVVAQKHYFVQKNPLSLSAKPLKNSEEFSSINNNDNHQQQQQQQHNKFIRIGASVTPFVAAACLFPTLCNAVDVANIAGDSAVLNNFAQTGFFQAFSLVFVSEIGDKTFFMAGLLAMKTSKLVSFIGSIGALGIMTLISVVIGQTFHAVPAGFADGLPLDDIAAVVAFTFFGIKTLKDALDMEEGESVMDEELAEAEEEVENSSTVKQNSKWGQLASIFALVFAAEFGDRSFLSTIALSAAQNPVSVFGGAVAAHAIATGIAVSGGSYLAKYVSERVIGIIGGVLFIVFAITTALGVF